MSIPPASADDGVVVTGRASIDVAPDVVIAELGAEVVGPELGPALREAEQALDRVRAGLAEGGVAVADIRTGRTSVWREERSDERGRPSTAVVHVSLGLQVTMRDTAHAGDLVHACLAAAGESARLHGLSFDVADDSGALSQARDRAFDDARTTAEQYAARAGRPLGQVRSIDETPRGWGALAPPRSLAARGGDAVFAGGSVPVEPGQQTVSAAVTVRWAWDD